MISGAVAVVEDDIWGVVQCAMAMTVELAVIYGLAVCVEERLCWGLGEVGSMGDDACECGHGSQTVLPNLGMRLLIEGTFS